MSEEEDLATRLIREEMEDLNPPGGDNPPPGGDNPPPGGDNPPPGGDNPPPGGDNPPPGGDNPPAEGTVNITELFGGRFKSVDEIKAANIPGILDEHKTLTEQNKELEEKYQAQINPWADPEISEYNEFVRDTKIKNYNVFQTLKNAELNGMDAYDALILRDQAKAAEKGRNFNAAQRRDYYESLYGVKEPNLEGVEDESEKARIINSHERDKNIKTEELTIASEDAMDYLGDLKGKIKTPDLEAQANQQLEERREAGKQLLNEWKPQLTSLSKELQKLSLQVKGDKPGEMVNLADFEVQPDQLKSVMDVAARTILNNNTEVNDQSLKEVKDLMTNLIFLNNKSNILRIVADQARSMSEDEWAKAYQNPSGQRIVKPVPPGGGDTKTGADAAFEQMTSGGRY